MIFVLGLKMRQGLPGLLEDVLLPGQKLLAEYSRWRSFMNGSLSEGL